MKRMIVAMSKGRRELADWIDDRTPQVMVAIAQLYLFSNGNRVHWRKEVWEKFFQMKKLSGNKKLPDAKFIFENSWGTNYHLVPQVVQYAIDKEEEYMPRKNIDYKALSFMMEDYFKWLSLQLSEEQYVNKQQVLDKLDELGLKEEGNKSI